MWAESGVYWYRGVQIAKTKGGSLYTAPELIIADGADGATPCAHPGTTLRPIDLDAMCAANSDLLGVIEDATVKRIVKEYEKFKDKLDIFHVAYSGGKDSAVLLDLVKKALPKGSFVVIFGDTGMEFPDTYATVTETQRQCEAEGIPFYIAKSHLEPEESWKLFGPPARVLRWCCSVHKSAPQTLKMREITGKDNYTGLDFVGVRRHESYARSTYEYENYGKKQKGQHSFNPLLEWTSAEIWLYIYTHKISINKAYIKGNTRVGCLFCPMATSTSNFFSNYNYSEQVKPFVSIIQDLNNWDTNEKDLQTYVTSGGWVSRRSGRGIKNNQHRYLETHDGEKLLIELINPNSDWNEWIKTAKTDSFPYEVQKTDTGAILSFNEKDFKARPSEGKIIRQALKKAAYCLGCRVCETNCPHGCIHFENGKVSIKDCLQCRSCHDLPGGCHAYNSLKIPQGEKVMRSIDCFGNHAIKKDWLSSFFELQDNFFTENTLGPNMLTHFKRFLRDADLIIGNKITDFSRLICDCGWETETALGLMLTNLVYKNAQFEWYVSRLDIDVHYLCKSLKDELLSQDIKEKSAGDIVQSFKRIVATPFGTVLNFGYAIDNSITRTKCSISDNRVLLYALYKFAEKCNLDKEFSVAYLYDEQVERAGVSPVRVFGLYDREELKSMLLGLSAAYPEFINATFTNDLQTISLRDKSAGDVLSLFKEDR